MSREAKPSGTVVVLRDAADDLELLLLQRSPRQGQAGPWVFPGGKVDEGDRREGATTRDDARRASVREAREEAGLQLVDHELVPISRWITPEIAPKRFDTWFFLTRVDRSAQVRVDGHEMCDHRWITPAGALAAHQRHELRLAPPTFVTVSWLRDHRDAETALRELGRRETIDFHPRIHRGEAGACMLYPGDAGYESNDPERPGARHRLWARPDRWHYEWDGGA